MSRARWKDYFIDQDGTERSIADVKRSVSFAWIEKNLGISRTTLERHRVPLNLVDPDDLDGVLRVYAGNHALTRTDWVFHFITTVGRWARQRKIQATF